MSKMTNRRIHSDITLMSSPIADYMQVLADKHNCSIQYSSEAFLSCILQGYVFGTVLFDMAVSVELDEMLLSFGG